MDLLLGSCGDGDGMLRTMSSVYVCVDTYPIDIVYTHMRQIMNQGLSVLEGIQALVRESLSLVVGPLVLLRHHPRGQQQQKISFG